MKIRDEIINFINQEEFCGALLLTGKWGSGKTYIIDDIRKKLGEGKKHIMVVVSMFGIDTAEALDKKVKSEILFSLFETTETRVKGIESTVKKVLNLISLSDKANPTIKKLKNTISIDLYELYDILSKPLLNERKLVLVFDDFERSIIPADVRIGIINEYVEKRKIHTIIVADEAKIDDDKYSEFKEKVISKTICLRPNYNEIINGIIEAYVETEPNYKCFLQYSKRIIKQVFIESKSDNIRTLKSVITDSERVYGLWRRNEHSITDERFSNVFYSFAASAFEIKSDNADLKEISDKYSYYGRNGSVLKSLQNWLKTGEWDEDVISDEINCKLFPPVITDEYKLLNYSIWDLEWDTIENALPIVLQSAYDGELNANETISLLERLLFFKKQEIIDSFEYNSKSLLNGWKKREVHMRDGIIKADAVHTFILPERASKLDDFEKQTYLMIEDLENKIPTWVARQEIIEGIKNRKVERHLGNSPRLCELDKDLLENIIEYFPVCTNEERRTIVSIVKDVDSSALQSNSTKEETANNLSRFLDFLNSIKGTTDDKITVMIANYGIEQLTKN